MVFERSNFAFSDIPDLDGKVVIITGGNTGIGYVTAREMARKNAHVFVASRNKERGEAAVEKIKAETGKTKVELLLLDLQDLKSVKQSAENFLAKNLPLHILVNNAGIMASPFRLTVDNIEEQFGVNHVGHFLFTKILLPKIEASAPSRILNVTSMAHQSAGTINFEHINEENAAYNFGRYAQSKLANILFTNALNKRLEGKQVYVNSVHPGFVNTELSRGAIDSWGVWGKVIFKVANVFAKNPDNGALTQLYVATSPEIEQENYRARYFVPYAKLSTSSKVSTDEELAEKLWKFTDDLVVEKVGA